MADLGTLADQGTPVASELGASATALGREFTELTPFAKRGADRADRPGAGARSPRRPLVATIPLARS